MADPVRPMPPGMGGGIPFFGEGLSFEEALSRRQLLKVGALLAGSAALAACGGSSSAAGNATVNVLSNLSGSADEKKALQDVIDAYNKSGKKAEVSTIDHQAYQANFAQYVGA